MSVHQETQGILSPWLRNQRLSRVARRIAPGSTVLDLACGTGALRLALPEGCVYFGADRVPVERSASDISRHCASSSFMCIDVAREGSPRVIADWMGTRPDVITMVAFLEHLKDPNEFVARFAPLLRKSGRILGTTPHPSGRAVHDVMAFVGVCSRTGADEHEAFLGRCQLESLAMGSGMQMTHYSRFLCGLNQVFEFAC